MSIKLCPVSAWSGSFLRLVLLLPLIGSTVFAQSVIYVDADATGPVHDGTSWCGAYLHLQDALAEAVMSGGAVTEIRVADGIYTPDQGANVTPGDRDATFQLLSDLAIRGGYAGCGAADPDERDIALNKTVLSGDLNGDDFGDLADPSRRENSLNIVTGQEINRTAVLDGVSVIGGYGRPYGGGIYNLFSSPTILDCTFAQNQAEFGGAMYNYRSHPKLMRCTFIGNRAKRVALGGAICNAQSAPTLLDCIFLGNTAIMGGVIYNESGSHSEAVNCLFARNSATTGGAISNAWSDPRFVNCTFAYNQANGFGGGIQNRVQGRPSLINCIVWGNADRSGTGEHAQLYNEPSSPTLPEPFWVHSSCVQGWTGDLGGVGNIGDDPLFIDPGHWDNNGTPEDPSEDTWINGEYHLQTGSPCIDAGDNTAVPADVLTDLDGKPRFINDPLVPDTGGGTPPIVDMGTYEHEAALLLDIHPGQCPNRLNIRSNARVQMAVVGTDVFDVTLIDTDSLVLERADGLGGSLTAWDQGHGHGNAISVGDSATPFYGDLCDCQSNGRDGIVDLVLSFRMRDLVRELELRGIGPKTPLMLTVRGQLLDGTPFDASDCILTIGGRPSVPGRLSSRNGKD